MTEIVIQLAYLFAAFLFISALRALGRPDSARRGMQLAAFGMAEAVAATLCHARIISYEWIAVGATVGAVAGYPLGMWVPMTAMPQRIALSHAFGALAATLVGVGEYANGFLSSTTPARTTVAALGLEVLFGGVTVTGSLIAFGKLQGILPGRPLIFRGQNALNIVLLAVSCCCLVWVIVYPSHVPVFSVMVTLAVLVGVLFVLPVGGADMPVVVSLLNSYAGLAAVATGFAIDNNILIVVGALDGLSGFILAIAMSKAMNRSFTNVLFGAFGSSDTNMAVTAAAGGEMTPTTVEDAALRLAYAERVIMVPGYGLAVSQAQHQMRELGDLIEKRGGDVRYAIHPVAGRMPGHMNVLLAEAGVPYDKLIDMDEINERFVETDVAVVVGANDVINPAARTNPASPIFGMPILKVDDAKSVLVLKRGKGRGFSGVENDLFVDPKTSMLFGDARQSLLDLGLQVKEA
jgi:H+-translocating NAD(P) transhydrogenase subunit beta